MFEFYSQSNAGEKCVNCGKVMLDSDAEWYSCPQWSGAVCDECLDELSKNTHEEDVL